MKRYPVDSGKMFQAGGATNDQKYTLNQLLQQSISNTLHSSACHIETKSDHGVSQQEDCQDQQMNIILSQVQSCPQSRNHHMQRTTAHQYVLIPTLPSAVSVAPFQNLTSSSRNNIYHHDLNVRTISKVGSAGQLNATGSNETVTGQRIVFSSEARKDAIPKLPPGSELLPATDLSSQTAVTLSTLEPSSQLSYSSTMHKRTGCTGPLPTKRGTLCTASFSPSDDCHYLRQFDWDEYLQLTNAKATPHSSFKHVEISLHNGFSPGMKLEVANKSDPSTYWVATLISTCGSLLLLRYDGCSDDRKADFWADVCTADLHPIGWCAQNGKVLQPPESIRNIHENWAEFLVGSLIGARTAPERLLSGPFKGKTVVEMIKPGMLLEVQDSQHPQHVWMVDVLRNVGGRLLLRYKGLTDADRGHDFWLFYLDVRLHQVGWGKAHHLTMKPPDSIKNKYSGKEQWAHVLSVSLKGLTEEHLVPACIFQDQITLISHKMKRGFKLAVLDPVDHTVIRPATIIKLVNEYFFLAEIDSMLSMTTNRAFLCHSGTAGLFSVDWCLKYDIPVTAPQGYSCENFQWSDYLKFTSAEAAPDACFTHSCERHEFEPGMKLEACSPYNLYEICVATVVKVYGSVLYLRLAASLPSSKKSYVDCYVNSSSQDIFPVGWCHSNNYPLLVPPSWQIKKPIMTNFKYLNRRDSAEFEKVLVKTQQTTLIPDKPIRSVMNPNMNSKLWCPVVCFNCVCKSGIFLNDQDLSKVPRYVGPGNTILVLKEVLSLLIRAAEKPHKLLKDLEDFTSGRWDQPCIIKTKFDGKKYQGMIHVVSTAREIPAFFKSLTQFLKCCPYLLTLEHPVPRCPLNCTKMRSVGYLLSNKGRGRKILIGRFNRKSTVTDLRSRNSKIRYRMHQFPFRLGECTRKMPRLRRLLHSASHLESYTSTSSPLQNPKSFIHKIQNYETQAKLSKLPLHSNPLNWSVTEVVEFLESTDCAKWANFFSHQHVDGQAFLLLTLPIIQECLSFKLGAALKIARHVERVKATFYERFACP